MFVGVLTVAIIVMMVIRVFIDIVSRRLVCVDVGITGMLAVRAIVVVVFVLLLLLLLLLSVLLFALI